MDDWHIPIVDAPRRLAQALRAQQWFKFNPTPEQMDTAVAAVKAMPGSKKDPNKISTFWPQPDDMPTISSVDFGDIGKATVTIKNLLSSNSWIKRDRLLWHVQHPGQRLNVNTFTSMPLTGVVPDGTVIIDGHHSLGSLMVYGVEKAPVWSLPMNPNAGQGK